MSSPPAQPGSSLVGVPLSWPSAPGDLPRAFPDRRSLAAELERQFPGVCSAEADAKAATEAAPAGDSEADSPALSPIRGGRRAAEERLEAINPPRYGASRNHLDGAVTRLSPYIRHGVLTLAEVREAVFTRLDAPGGDGRAAGEKLINELGWRDYWQRLWQLWGDGIWSDREPLKTGLPPQAYAAELPGDIKAGRTGLACIDGFARELRQIGWLHNHARMWLAAYVVHWRRVRWQAGAGWFLRHLLDGDPASNNLSWQWVASSFSRKPYIFNRANLERFSSGLYCRECPAARAGRADDPGGCPFDASYETLQERLFQGDAPLEAGKAGAPFKPGEPPVA